ncbi:MAG: hypothetical protein WCY24_00300 [Lutispora sp.]
MDKKKREKKVFINEEGIKMEALFVNTKQSKLSDIKARAVARKQRDDLRHTPNISDINTANKNAKELNLHQLEVIKRK